MEVRSVETVIEALNKARVEYLIVGGLAVNAYGYERLTGDIDLVIGLEPDNIIRGLRALLDIGYQMAVPVSPEEFANPELRETWRKEKNMLVLRMWSEVHRRTPIDVFVYEPFDFAREVEAAQWIELRADLKAPIVSYKTLIAMKEQSERNKDKLDVESLRKLDPFR